MKTTVTRRALTATGLALLLACGQAAWGQASPPAPAASAPKPPPAQPAAAVVIKTGKAICNDGSRAQYYLRKTQRADYKKKWLVVFQGGGSCFSNLTCAERWTDLTGNNRFIGSHANMVGNGSSAGMQEFDGRGILDEDGDGPSTRDDNPFRHFNKIHVHYCSSDSWKGRGGKQILDRTLPNGQRLRMDILFHGAEIAEEVVKILMLGKTDSGGSDELGKVDEIPDDASSEVVFYGQSAGASGLASQLDSFAKMIAGPVGQWAGGPKVWGIIDSNDIVGLPFWIKDESIWQAASYWSGSRVTDRWDPASVHEGKLAFDESCHATYPRYPDYILCHNPSRLMLHYITTPIFVVENAYDWVIHGAYEERAAWTPDRIRADITAGARAFPAGTGLFIPNFTKAQHVVGMTNSTFLASDNNSSAPPHMVAAGQSSGVSMAKALQCFRAKQNGQTNRACRFINETAR